MSTTPAGGVQLLQWSLDGDSVRAIRAAETRMDAAMAAADLRVIQLPTLNKALIKSSGLSPDAVMQVLLQLAHWRAHSYTAVTYESVGDASPCRRDCTPSC